jgi:hypothetical protein
MNTYVKNIGMTKTYINENDKIYTNELKWDGNYDGNIAKLNLDVDNNGKKENIHMELDNQDLLNILNTNAVNTPIDERLKTDYLISNPRPRPNPYINSIPYNPNQKLLKRKLKSKRNNKRKKRKYTRKYIIPYNTNNITNTNTNTNNNTNKL